MPFGRRFGLRKVVQCGSVGASLLPQDAARSRPCARRRSARSLRSSSPVNGSFAAFRRHCECRRWRNRTWDSDRRHRVLTTRLPRHNGVSSAVLLNRFTGDVRASLRRRNGQRCNGPWCLRRCSLQEPGSEATPLKELAERSPEASSDPKDRCCAVVQGLPPVGSGHAVGSGRRGALLRIVHGVAVARPKGDLARRFDDDGDVMGTQAIGPRAKFKLRSWMTWKQTIRGTCQGDVQGAPSVAAAKSSI